VGVRGSAWNIRAYRTSDDVGGTGDEPNPDRVVGFRVVARDGSDAAPGSTATLVREDASQSPRLSLPHRPPLDGIRGIAILSIMLYHGAGLDRIGWLERWTGGLFLSLSAFFTLSGFLICSLLLHEESGSGTVALGDFWIRRARRLLPAVYVLLAAVVLLAPLLAFPTQLDGLGGQVWASIFYVVNWDLIAGQTDYAAMFVSSPSPLQHLWSLAVEEQWYVLVPLASAAVIWFRRSRRRLDRQAALTRLAWGLVASAVAGTAWMWFVSGGEYTNRAYMGTDTRLAEMVVGAAAAAFLARGFRSPGTVRRWVLRAAPVAMVVLAIAWVVTPFELPALYRGGFTLHAVLVALVIVAAVQPRGAASVVFGVGLLTFAGRISYGLYLFHWPVMLWMTPDRLGLDATLVLVLQLGLTLALALLSERFVELPVRRGQVLKGRWALVALGGAVAVIALGVARLPDADPRELLALGPTEQVVFPSSTVPPVSTSAAPADAQGPSAATTAPPTTLPPPPLRVMVVGDSFAESIVIGLQRWGVRTGTMAVMDQGVPNCPFGRSGFARALRIPREIPEECAERDATLEAAVRDFDPDVVLLAGSFWDITDRRPDNFASYTSIGDPDYDRFLVEELRHVTQIVSNGGAQVVWANSPYWDPVEGTAIFMGDPPYVEAERSRVDSFNSLLTSTVAGRPATSVLDLQGWIRAQPGGDTGKELRPDGVHFSEATTDLAASWIGPELLRTAGRQSPA
jgi:peptidoglycan/LPS O-acetylase OafA/YrhL